MARLLGEILIVGVFFAGAYFLTTRIRFGKTPKEHEDQGDKS